MWAIAGQLKLGRALEPVTVEQSFDACEAASLQDSECATANVEPAAVELQSSCCDGLFDPGEGQQIGERKANHLVLIVVKTFGL